MTQQREAITQETSRSGPAGGPDAPGGTPYPDIADTSHATAAAAAFFRSFFTAKTSRDVEATHAHFHPGLEGRRLGDAAAAGVAADGGLGVGDGELDVRRQLHADRVDGGVAVLDGLRLVGHRVRVVGRAAGLDRADDQRHRRGTPRDRRGIPVPRGQGHGIGQHKLAIRILDGEQRQFDRVEQGLIVALGRVLTAEEAEERLLVDDR